MRIAVFSDIHGNTAALDAVLAGIRASGEVDALWIAGDVADMGADPRGVVERLRSIGWAEVVCVRGNADRAVYDGDLVTELASVRRQSDEDALTTLTFVEEAAWTRGVLAGTVGLEWIRALPLEVRRTLPDGTRVLVVHARPGADDGDGFVPGMTGPELRALLGSPDAGLVLVGHTHQPVNSTIDGVRVINAGSVSNPVVADQRAQWLLIEADTGGYRIERRSTAYDIPAYLQQVRDVAHPARSIIWSYFGQECPD